MTITKEFLSSSTNGRGIKITTTATPGTTIHTAHATAKDEIWLDATNTSASEVTVSVEFGGTTSPDDIVQAKVPANSTVNLVAGRILSNSLVMSVFAGTANVISVGGFVNRITA